MKEKDKEKLQNIFHNGKQLDDKKKKERKKKNQTHYQSFSYNR